MEARGVLHLTGHVSWNCLKRIIHYRIHISCHATLYGHAHRPLNSFVQVRRRLFCTNYRKLPYEAFMDIQMPKLDVSAFGVSNDDIPIF
jgi:hypothetical protein